MTTRQQLRQRAKAVHKQGRSLVVGGLVPIPFQDDLTAVATVFARMLADRADPQRASNAAALMHQLTTASAQKTPGTAKLACAKGCGFCCHTWVAATAPEIFLLARSIRADTARDPNATIAQIIARSAHTIGLSPVERIGAKRPCPLLIENACSQYRTRPAVCRQATSFDLSACIDEYEGRNLGAGVSISKIHLAHARNSRMAMMAALKVTGLPQQSYELAAALCCALQNETAEAEWLAGGDPLAGIATGPAEPPVIVAAIDAIAADLERH